jgi:hypothetical protein
MESGNMQNNPRAPATKEDGPSQGVARLALV